MLGVLRTNFRDNVELNVKARVFERDSETVPLMAGVSGGIAWNTNAPAGADENESQAYVQLLLNARLGNRVAIGVVPTFLRNPRVQDIEPDNAFVLGVQEQLYMSDQTSLLGEWGLSEGREDLAYDGVAFGLELEVGGHFFKILLTNQAQMNPTQFLGGTPFKFEADEWRIGFNITRLLTL